MLPRPSPWRRRKLAGGAALLSGKPAPTRRSQRRNGPENCEELQGAVLVKVQKTVLCEIPSGNSQDAMKGSRELLIDASAVDMRKTEFSCKANTARMLEDMFCNSAEYGSDTDSFAGVVAQWGAPRRGGRGKRHLLGAWSGATMGQSQEWKAVHDGEEKANQKESSDGILVQQV